MNKRMLGLNGPKVSASGQGYMGMSDLYGPADRSESIATIHNAIDEGITLFDTGDFYGMGQNELLIKEALRGRKRKNILLSVKFGALRDPAGNWIGIDGRPQAVNDFRKYSPRFSGENLDRNLSLVETLRTTAEAKNATVAQLAINWVLSRGQDIVPLVGARHRARLSEALGALELDLTLKDLSDIEGSIPEDAAAGTRYPEQQMAHLDRESGA